MAVINHKVPKQKKKKFKPVCLWFQEILWMTFQDILLLGIKNEDDQITYMELEKVVVFLEIHNLTK